MKDVSKVDKNFIVKTKIEKDDIKFFNPEEKPFELYGVVREGEKLRRMPEYIAKTVSEGVYALHANTAGGRIRFVTNSPYVAVSVKMGEVGKMPHFAFTGSIGLDVYADNIFCGSFVPPIDITDGYESIRELGDLREREITINLPLYSEVKEIYIGLKDGSIIKSPAPYKNKKPVVFYGSSITQGGCASRPGMSYQAILSRMLNYDYINLGFSGSAKGEDEIVDYIKSLEMSMFVMDYDHNAPTLEHLKLTHEKMFKEIRKYNPKLPIILMPRPKYILSDEEKERLEIIKTTYNNAVLSGDKNVYFIDNKQLTKLCLSDGMVDNNHPTDLGFLSMAQGIYDVIKDIDIDK